MAIRPGVWSRRSLRFQSLLLVGALVALIVVAAGSIVVSLNAGQQQNESAMAAAALRDEAHVLAGQMSAEENAIHAYALTRDASLLVDYESIRQRAMTSRATLAAMPARGPVVSDRARMLGAADDLQRWADGVRDLIHSGAPVSAADYDDGIVLESSYEGTAEVFELRAGSEATAAQNASRAAHQAVLQATLLGTGIGSAGLLLLAWLFFWRNLQPITRLAAAAGQLSTGGEAAIPTGEGSEELRRLSDALTLWQHLTVGRLTLAEDMAAISQQVSPDEVVARAARLLARQFEADLVGITLFDADKVPVTHLTAEPGLGLAGFDLVAVEADSPIALCLETRQPLLADLREPRWPARVTDFAKRVGLGSMLLVPLVSAGEMLGAVGLARRIILAEFTEDDLSRMGVIVPQVAASLNVARLIKSLAFANRHKDEFVAHMSHELRTPLNSILGFSQLLGTEDFGPLNERQQRYVGNVVSSGAHLLSLIDDVLDLTKVEAGQLEVSPETVVVGPLLTGCLEELQPLAREKQLELVLRARGSLAVRADERRVRQVILNLASNAIKFTPEGGSVTLLAERDGSEICLRVRDTGVGIPAAQRERIFEAFTQVRSGRTRSEQGTGLGLALSRRLIELMGGSLVVDSRAGHGATFTVRLPAAIGAAATAAL